MTRFYRALLRLYPASFRAEYGAELVHAYEEGVRGRGPVSAMGLALSDVVPNALAAHGALLRQDLHYAMRSLRNSRGFAAATILVTALGVGANTAMFSVADFVLLRPLAFPRPEEIVRLCEGPREGGGWGCMNQFAPAVFRDVAAGARSFRDVAAFSRVSFNLVGEDAPLRVTGANVTPNLLGLLGVAPAVGRVFDPALPAQDAQGIVISHGLWQQEFGGEAGVVGRSVTLNEQPYVVIGVMPAHFRFPNSEAQLWVPLQLRDADYVNRQNNYLEGVARLAPGVAFEQARAELELIARRLEAEHPAEHPKMGFSFFRLRDEMSPRYRLILLVLCGASLSMLLLACANLASLALVRAAGRERELAVRAALGAGRERLIRQMLTESLCIAALGGIAGGFVAWLTVPLLSQLVPTSLAVAQEPAADARVFVLAAVFAAAIGIGFGLLPAVRGAGDLSVTLRDGARGSSTRQRLRQVLVAVEVGISVVLLTGTGLLIRAVWNVQEVSPGFDANEVVTLATQLTSPRYSDPVRRTEFYDRVLSGVRAVPGVESAGYTSGLPMVLTGGITAILKPGEEVRPGEERLASIRMVTPGFFETMRIPLRDGRVIEEMDRPGGQLIAIVSESFAREFWPDGNAIGATFSTRGQQRTIVGVVGDIRVRGLERTSEPQLYIPSTQPPDGIGDNYWPKVMVVRSPRADVGMAAAIRDIVRQVDPLQPVSNVRMLSEVVEGQTVTRRTQVRILGALALLALLLSGVGIQGLLAYTVAQRDREFGVRLALGAQPGLMARMVLSDGLRVALAGAVPGVFIAYLTARGMSALLFGVRPEDPVTFSVAAVACVATAFVGSLRPAMRAASIEPLKALGGD